MHVQFVRKSSNVKTGPIPTTTSPRRSCPSACPLAGAGGCYAEAGYYTRMNWDKVDSGERGMPWGDFLGKVAKLPDGQLWRHNVAGDLPQASDNVIDGAAVRELARVNTGKRGFTYTHYPATGSNLAVLRDVNALGFTVNVSTNSASEARETRARTGLPTVTIMTADQWDSSGKRDGDIVRCPAEYSDSISCATCQLCQKRDRKDIVGFTVHGTRSKAAADVIASVS